jgi:peptidoglycan/xylan/chitin deacetylase (PgdA/CDA1 family)
MALAPHLPRRLLLGLMGADRLAPALRAVGRGLVSIFTLHRFADPELGVVGHDPVALRDHLAYLRRHRYRLISLTEVLRLLDEPDGDSGAPAVAFTVDDGYAGFARIAAPIFAEYDCPVTLFVTTGFVDGQLWLWWDRVAHLFKGTQRCSLLLDLGDEVRPYGWSTPDERDQVRQDVLSRLEWVDAPERDAAIAGLAGQLDVELPESPPPAYAPVTWDEVRRTARRGATFGPHTVTHRILSLAPDDACQWEIQESYRRLRQETDAYVPVFCYPNGEPRAFGRRELEATQRAGFSAALTTVPDYAASQCVRPWGALGRFALPRFPYPEDRPHLVHTVAGLPRLQRMVRGCRGTRLSEVMRLLAAMSGLCAGLPA